MDGIVDVSPDAYKEALEKEREGYVAAGKTERVKEVDAALKAGNRPKGPRSTATKSAPETTEQTANE
jgi:hypothetical protein